VVLEELPVVWGTQCGRCWWMQIQMPMFF